MMMSGWNLGRQISVNKSRSTNLGRQISVTGWQFGAGIWEAKHRSKHHISRVRVSRLAYSKSYKVELLKYSRTLDKQPASLIVLVSS